MIEKQSRKFPELGKIVQPIESSLVSHGAALGADIKMRGGRSWRQTTRSQFGLDSTCTTGRMCCSMIEMTSLRPFFLPASFRISDQRHYLTVPSLLSIPLLQFLLCAPLQFPREEPYYTYRMSYWKILLFFSFFLSNIFAVPSLSSSMF